MYFRQKKKLMYVFQKKRENFYVNYMNSFLLFANINVIQVIRMVVSQHKDVYQVPFDHVMEFQLCRLFLVK